MQLEIAPGQPLINLRLVMFAALILLTCAVNIMFT